MPVWVDECQVDRVTGVLAPYPRAIVCVRIPIGDPAFVKRFLELKKESDKRLGGLGLCRNVEMPRGKSRLRH